MNDILLLMIAAPLVGSILNGLVLRSKLVKRAGSIATFCAAVSFVCAVTLFSRLVSADEVTQIRFPWLKVGTLELVWGFTFDRLTAVMALFVTGIGSLIHLYSIGYMSEERSPYRYFAYLNLFLFNMLVLITGDTLPVVFVGWEGVGLCSYLLIGYWFEDIDKANAGMKAFILNRIGDAGFLIGMFLIFMAYGTLEFSQLASITLKSSSLNLDILNLAGVFLFIGAMGKSAQIPLYVWLPDAMAGPTPVSALIHAATMVTAGVYLVARMSFLYQVTESASLFIAVIGGATALFAALIAVAQNDIKKVLAYSTVSQLGLMFLALGCGAYFAAIFHVLTHAFFKALLFLGAGSVIHALDGEQDIRKMGGLAKHLPWTFATFAVGTLAICGIPPLAGFFSKDTILYDVMIAENYGTTFWILASVTSALTAFYMTRLFVLVFLGQSRVSESHHPHESPPVMLIALVVLAVGSAIAGFLGVPEGLHFMPNYLKNFLQFSLAATPEGHGIISEHLAMSVATLSAFVSVFLGFVVYGKPRTGRPLGALHAVMENKFYVDELYGLIIVSPFQKISQFLATIVDRKIIDAFFMLPASLSRGGARVLSALQTGFVQFYLLMMLLGGLVLLAAAVRGTIIW